MSLINDALKKAQKQRQEEAARPADPGQAEPPPPPIPPKAPPASPSAPEPDPVSVRQIRRDHASGGRGKIFVIAGGVVAIMAVGWWALGGRDASVEVATSPDPVAGSAAREASSEPLVVTPQSIVERTENAPVELAPGAEETTIIAPPVAVVFETREIPGRIAEVKLEPASPEVAAETTITEETTPPTLKSESVLAEAPTPVAVEQPQPKQVAPAVLVQVEEPVPAPIAQVRPVQVKSVEPVSLPANPSRASEPTVVIVTEEESGVGATPVTESLAKANPAVLTYLETAKVTGVRASDTDPKVLMNNRVYRLNDVVDRDLQLRITGIASRELQFTDARDFVYTKRF
jgi:hypothetical protein